MKTLKSNANPKIATNLDEFLNLVNEVRKQWGFEEDDVATPWYRGHQRKHWKLEPNIIRLRCFDRETEDEIREEFATRASALSRYEPMPTNDWDLYFLMQHYGAPTRLLDWTESPAIALYFAVRDNPGYYDSSVWMLDPYELNRQVIRKGEVASPGALGVSERDLNRVKPWLPQRGRGTSIPNAPLAVFPTHIARRISSQRSCFTVHGQNAAGFLAFEKGKRPCIKKVIIPGHAVKAMRLSLRNFGIDDTTIFPDLEGLGRALSTAYRDLKKDSPHRGVYVRLRPSKLDKSGVGVFAIRSISKGTRVFAEENEEIFWMPKASLPKSTALRKLYDDFAIIKGSLYGSPVSFNRLTPAWFMNNSKAPNLLCDENYDFYTRRDIRPGEELTIDYDTFSDEPAKKARDN